MSIVDSFLKKMKVVSEDEDFDEYEDEEYDDYEDDDQVDDREDDYDEDENEEEPAPVKKKQKPLFARPSSAYTQRSAASAPANNVVGMHGKAGGNGAEVCMIVPKSFEDANTIADVLLSHRAVVLNLENNDMASAQRIIDFASGACYTVGGSLQKISRKIFMIVPQDMNLSGDFESLVSDMVDLNSVNIMK